MNESFEILLTLFLTTLPMTLFLGVLFLLKKLPNRKKGKKYEKNNNKL